MRKSVVLMVALVLVTLISGCTSQPPVLVPGEEAAELVGRYKLRTMDPLQISLLGIPQEKAIETVIDEQGNITLPYIEKPVQAAGLTSSQLERKIQSIYIDGQIYRHITVNVLTSAKSYFMEGEIRNPQEYPLQRRITLLQAIAAAGGYTEYANPHKITITRNDRVIEVNAKDLEKNPEWDIPVEAGDRIKVHRSLL